MKKHAIFVLGLVFVFTGLALAQTKTITNADLEKYRQKRLAAEKEYRENYRELGFPSPEELEGQREQSQRELSELAQRLRQERIAKENQRQNNVYYQNNNGQYSNQARYPYPNPNFVDYGQYQTSTYVYPRLFNRRFFRHNNRRNVRRGRFFRFTGPRNVRRNNRRNSIIRTDRRLNRIQRNQTRRGNRNLMLGVGVVRSIRGN